jgi:hypothetical protein
MKAKGASMVDVKPEPELEYAEHCRDADLRTAAFRDCLSYYTPLRSGSENPWAR